MRKTYDGYGRQKKEEEGRAVRARDKKKESVERSSFSKVMVKEVRQCNYMSRQGLKGTDS